MPYFKEFNPPEKSPELKALLNPEKRSFIPRSGITAPKSLKPFKIYGDSSFCKAAENFYPNFPLIVALLLIEFSINDEKSLIPINPLFFLALSLKTFDKFNLSIY